MLKKIRSNQYKGRLISHGGCLSCKVPLIENVGSCYDCMYFNWTGGGKLDDSELENKSERYKNIEDIEDIEEIFDSEITETKMIKGYKMKK